MGPRGPLPAGMVRGGRRGEPAVDSSRQCGRRCADRFLGGLDGGAIVRPALQGHGPAEEEAAESWGDLWQLFEEC